MTDSPRAATRGVSRVIATTITTIVRTNFFVSSADFNHDNIVDGADYVLWRKYLNQSVTLPNDSTPGTSPGDYDVWRAHFGQPPGSGAGAITNGAVPEPATLVLLFVALACSYGTRRRHPRR